MRRSEDSLGELVLFFHYVGLILDINHLYPLNHLTGPSFDLIGLPKYLSLSWYVCVRGQVGRTSDKLEASSPKDCP